MTTAYTGLCDDRRPHLEHDVRMGLLSWRCPGRPEPDSLAGRVWAAIYDAVSDALHGDQSGLDDGVAAAVHRLTAEGLLADLPRRWLTVDEVAALRGEPGTVGRHES